MGRTETEIHGHRATIATLVFEEVGSVFRAHPRSGHVAAAAANQFFRIEIGIIDFGFASRLAAVVRLKTNVIVSIVEESSTDIFPPPPLNLPFYT